ncbi:initiation factor 2 [Aureobasidium sp. EXF-10728]|nr:initiation factor 2 [Aureobasidium sp. EXF-10728]
MRRSKLLRASSSQSVCSFCAGRINPHALQTTTTRSNAFHSTATRNQDPNDPFSSFEFPDAALETQKVLQAAKRQREEQEAARRKQQEEMSEKLAAQRVFGNAQRQGSQTHQNQSNHPQQPQQSKQQSRQPRPQKVISINQALQQRQQKPNQHTHRPPPAEARAIASARAADMAANAPLNRVQTAQRDGRNLDAARRRSHDQHLESQRSENIMPSLDRLGTQQKTSNNKPAPSPVSNSVPRPQFKAGSFPSSKPAVKPPSWMSATAAPQPAAPLPSSAPTSQPSEDPFSEPSRPSEDFEDIFSADLKQARKAMEPVPAPPLKIRYAPHDLPYETPRVVEKSESSVDNARRIWQEKSIKNQQREEVRQSASEISAEAGGLSQEEEKMLEALLARKNKSSSTLSSSPMDSLFGEQEQQTRRALVEESKMRVQQEQAKKIEEERSRGPRFSTTMVNSRDEPDETPFENAQNWNILKSRRQSSTQHNDQTQSRQQERESNTGGNAKFSPISAGDIDARFEEYRQRRPKFGGFNINSLNVESRPADRARPAMICVRCNQPGHGFRDCPNPPKPGWVDRAPGQQPARGERPDRNATRADRDERRPREPREVRSAGRDMATAYGTSVTEEAPAETQEPDPAESEAARKLAERTARRAARFVEEDDEADAPKAAPVKGRRSRFDNEVDDAEDDDKPRRGRRSRFDDDDVEGDYGAMRNNRDERKKARQAKKDKAAKEAARQAARQARRAEAMSPINLPEFVSVSKLAQLTNVTYQEMAEKMEELGFENTSHDHILGAEEAGLIAMEYNFDPTLGAQEEAEAEERDLKALPEPAPEDKEFLPVRPPVVAIMGHVDHGKTTILDYLRKSSIAASEHGGITQHIGAFSVALSSGKTITFLDTPGHAAFLEMRKRGATVTDIIILVVAADDSVKPQTIEAIKHAQSAHVPIIVAVNKIDKEEANVDRVKQDLARHGVEIEDFGGETQVVPVSGKTGQGIDELEDAAVTLSEILDHRADTEGQVEGWVIEATTKPQGRVATVLVRRGTLKPGTIIVAGKTWARVRSLRNEAGVTQMSAGPGTPIEVDGWRDQPDAGDEVIQAPNEQKAADVVSFRDEKAERIRMAEDMEKINIQRREQQVQRDLTKEAAAAEKAAEKAARAGGTEIEAQPSRKAALDADDNETPGHQTVPFIIKADVSGSVEAVSTYLLQMTNPLCSPKLLRASVGPVSEFDIEHADAAGGHIISFNLPHDPDSVGRAERKGIKILEQNVIYRIVDDVRAVLEEKLPPQKIQKVTGEAEVAMSFEIGVGGRKKMKIAGLKVRNGVVARGSRVRVTRGEDRVYDGIVTSLKNVKKDVQEMRRGTECGMGFEGWEGFEVGDMIQTFEERTQKRTLPL